MGSAPSMEIVLCLTSAIFISIHESIPVPKYRIGNRSDSIPFVFVLFCFVFSSSSSSSSSSRFGTRSNRVPR